MTPSIYDLYEFYLEPRDLKEQAHLVQVQSVKAVEVFVSRARKMEKKLVVRFVNRRKAMILNKTQAGDMAEIAGTDDYTKWPGVQVVLVAGRAQNGCDTIQITTPGQSGDLDLDFPQDWKAKFNQLITALAYSEKQADEVLKLCENSYHTAFEMLKSQHPEINK